MGSWRVRANARECTTTTRSGSGKRRSFTGPGIHRSRARGTPEDGGSLPFFGLSAFRSVEVAFCRRGRLNSGLIPIVRLRGCFATPSGWHGSDREGFGGCRQILSLTSLVSVPGKLNPLAVTSRAREGAARGNFFQILIKKRNSRGQDVVQKSTGFRR